MHQNIRIRMDIVRTYHHHKNGQQFVLCDINKKLLSFNALQEFSHHFIQ